MQKRVTIIIVLLISYLSVTAQKDKIYTSLEEALQHKDSVYVLDLSGQGLEELPSSISNLTQLQSCRLTFNSIKTLPESLGDLTQLQYLDLGFNSISELPKSMSKLTALNTLHIEDNVVTNIPESLRILTGLQMLFVGKNQITEEEKEILEQSLPDCVILSY